MSPHHAGVVEVQFSAKEIRHRQLLVSRTTFAFSYSLIEAYRIVSGTSSPQTPLYIVYCICRPTSEQTSVYFFLTKTSQSFTYKSAFFFILTTSNNVDDSAQN